MISVPKVSRFSLKKERSDRLLPWLILIVLENNQYVPGNITLPDGQKVIQLTVEKEQVKLLPCSEI